MRYIKNLCLLLAILSLAALPACELVESSTTCDDGWGVLSVKNASSNSIHKVFIDGTYFVTLEPGESKEIENPVGKFYLEFNGVGGGGCYSSLVTIPDCGTVYRNCSN